MTPSRNASPSTFSIFRNRNFSLLWTGQLVSTMGSALTSLAASIYIYRLTGSALSVGLMLMATAAPSLVVGLFAGVFVDRYDRKKIMITADILRAGLILLIPILVPLNVAWLYVMVMLTAAIGQFYDPAHESVLPEVASDEELAAANSMMAISSFGSTAVGFAAAGLIASAASIDWAFYLDAVSFLFSAVCVFLIHIKPIQAEEDTSVKLVVKNLRAGIHQLFRTPILKSLFLVQIIVLISFGLSNALLLPFAVKALSANEFQYGLQEGITSIGFVIGSLLMAKVFDRLQAGAWMAISYLGMGDPGCNLFVPFFNPPGNSHLRIIRLIECSCCYREAGDCTAEHACRNARPGQQRFLCFAGCAVPDRHGRSRSCGLHEYSRALSGQCTDAGAGGCGDLFPASVGTVPRPVEADNRPAQRGGGGAQAWSRPTCHSVRD